MTRLRVALIVSAGLLAACASRGSGLGTGQRSFPQQDRGISEDLGQQSDQGLMTDLVGNALPDLTRLPDLVPSPDLLPPCQLKVEKYTSTGWTPPRTPLTMFFAQVQLLDNGPACRWVTMTEIAFFARAGNGHKLQNFSLWFYEPDANGDLLAWQLYRLPSEVKGTIQSRLDRVLEVSSSLNPGGQIWLRFDLDFSLVPPGQSVLLDINQLFFLIEDMGTRYQASGAFPLSHQVVTP